MIDAEAILAFEMELSRVIQFLSARQSLQARLEADGPLQIWMPEGWQSGQGTIPAAQLNRMLVEAAPANVRAVVHDQNALYAYDVAGADGMYRVDVEAVGGRRTVWVTRLDDNGQPLRPHGDALGDVLPNAGNAAPKADDDLPDVMRVPFWSDDSGQSAPPPVPVSSSATPPPAPPIEESAVPSYALNSPNDQWFYAHAGQSMGPHTLQEMMSLITSGALPRETMVFNSRVGDWQQAKLSTLGRYYRPEQLPPLHTPESQWKPPTEGEIRSEKAFVRLVVGGVIGVVVFLISWFAIAEVRYNNRSSDFVTQASSDLQAQSATASFGALHNIHLKRDETEHSVYEGTAQYSNNYLADVRVEVENRDFWARPSSWNVAAQPHDFSNELESLVQSRMNQRYSARGSTFRMTGVSLSHGDNNVYSGTCEWDDGTSGVVQTQITAFDADGQLSTWTMKIGMDN